MVQLGYNQLVQLRNDINALKETLYADIYSINAPELPGRPVAWAHEIGKKDEVVLVILKDETRVVEYEGMDNYLISRALQFGDAEMLEEVTR